MQKSHIKILTRSERRSGGPALASQQVPPTVMEVIDKLLGKISNYM